MSSSNILRLWKDALTLNGEKLDIGKDNTLKLVPGTDDTTIEFGDGTTDPDIKSYLGATTKYIKLDVDNSRVQLEDVDMLLGDNDHIDLGDGNDVRLRWNGTYLEGGPASGLWAGAPSPADPQYHAIAHDFFDDFHLAPVDAGLVWHEEDDSGTGTNAATDAANGVANVVTAAADNDYHAISSFNEHFKFASGKKLWFEARFLITEGTATEPAWWFGLTDTLTTGGFQANAAGPLASYDGALIWKDESTLAVDFETSNLTSQATATADATFVSGKWSRVGFYFDGAATTSTVTPYYDMNEAGVWTAGTTKNITLSGLEEMHVVAGVKAGPTAAAETLSLDYIKCVQLR